MIWLLCTAALAMVLALLGMLRARARAGLFELRCQLVSEDLAKTRDELTHERRQRQRAEAEAVAGVARHEFYAALQHELEKTRDERDVLGRDNARLVAELDAEHEKLAVERSSLEEIKSRLLDSFRAAGAEALEKSSHGFLQLAEQRFRQLLVEHDGRDELQRATLENMVRPVRELLDKQAQAVGELERKRESAYTELIAQIGHVATSHQRLNAETGKLVAALSSPGQRGRWGELQLQRVVELAGMVKHCDFSTQVHVSDGETTRRPDMVVHIPGGGSIIVDAKVPLEAYLRAIAGDGERPGLLIAHARQVREHVTALAGKRYWQQFHRSPELVVLFMPVESALGSAMEVDPELHADALERRVLIATPMLLVGLLRAIAYGWQQDAIADNARRIARVGNELHERIALFVEHLAKLGRSLQAGNHAYNDAIGSLERRVLVSARKLRELGATRADEIAAPPVLQLGIRGLMPLLDEDAPASLEEPS